jgi:hypothetical protein
MMIEEADFPEKFAGFDEGHDDGLFPGAVGHFHSPGFDIIKVKSLGPLGHDHLVLRIRKRPGPFDYRLPEERIAS